MKLKIFWTGTHTDSAGNTATFTAADLQQIAATYDARKHEAPVVIGHPKTNDPAYGWVKALSYENDSLFADVQQVDSDFKALVNAGRYKKVSAAFYPPTEPTNPVSGAYYLRHVGFLGAQPPALKGQPTNITFSEKISILTYEFEEMPETTPNDKVTPPADKSSTEPDKALEFAEKFAYLQKKEAELKQREHELKQTETAQKRAEIALFMEKLTTEGKVLPRQAKPLTEFILGIQESNATFAYSEEGQTVTVNRTQWFKEFLQSLPNQVEYAELTPKDKDKDKEPKSKIPESDLEKYLKSQFKDKDKDKK